MGDPFAPVSTVFLSELQLYFFHPFQMYSSPSVIRERQPLISSRVRTELSGLLSIRSRTVLMARAEEREIYMEEEVIQMTELEKEVEAQF